MSADTSADTPTPKLYIFDGSAMIYRAHFATGRRMSNARGLMTGALFGFLQTLRSILDQHDPQWVAMGHDRIGLTIAKDSPLSLQLGDGDYELTDSLTGQHAQRFTVPATASVTVDAKLSRARADRR